MKLSSINYPAHKVEANGIVVLSPVQFPLLTTSNNTKSKSPVYQILQKYKNDFTLAHESLVKTICSSSPHSYKKFGKVLKVTDKQENNKDIFVLFCLFTQYFYLKKSSNKIISVDAIYEGFKNISHYIEQKISSENMDKYSLSIESPINIDVYPLVEQAIIMNFEGLKNKNNIELIFASDNNDYLDAILVDDVPF